MTPFQNGILDFSRLDKTRNVSILIVAPKIISEKILTYNEEKEMEKAWRDSKMIEPSLRLRAKMEIFGLKGCAPRKPNTTTTTS